MAAHCLQSLCLAEAALHDIRAGPAVKGIKLKHGKMRLDTFLLCRQVPGIGQCSDPDVASEDLLKGHKIPLHSLGEEPVRGRFFLRVDEKVLASDAGADTISILCAVLIDLPQQIRIHCMFEKELIPDGQLASVLMNNGIRPDHILVPHTVVRIHVPSRGKDHIIMRPKQAERPPRAFGNLI